MMNLTIKEWERLHSNTPAVFGGKMNFLNQVAMGGLTHSEHVKLKWMLYPTKATVAQTTK